MLEICETGAALAQGLGVLVFDLQETAKATHSLFKLPPIFLDETW